MYMHDRPDPIERIIEGLMLLFTLVLLAVICALVGIYKIGEMTYHWMRKRIR